MPNPPQRPGRRPPRVAGQRRLPPPAASEAPPTVAGAARGPMPNAGVSTAQIDAPAEETVDVDVAAPAPSRRLPRIGVPKFRWSALRWPSVGRPDIVGAALVAAVVALATITGLYLQGWLHANAVTSARNAAVTAAKSELPQVVSYDYRQFDANVKQAEKNLTGSFKKSYLDTQQNTVRATAIKYKATVKADVVAVGAISGGTGKVHVLVFLDQTSSNTKLAAPRIDRYRVLVDLTKANGHWLISGITPI